jgi:hypothetical protein
VGRRVRTGVRSLGCFHADEPQPRTPIACVALTRGPHLAVSLLVSVRWQFLANRGVTEHFNIFATDWSGASWHIVAGPGGMAKRA